MRFSALLLRACAGIVAVFLAVPAHAASIGLNLTGPGVSGSFVLTYGSATDSKFPNAFEITGISGTFSDSNNSLGITNASIFPLVAVTHDTPEATNLLAPHDFSRFAVATGLSPMSNGFLTYDNLYWPGGASPTASDYTASGGLFDIYGLMFTLSGGQTVDIWSNGSFTGGPVDYGVAVATSDKALDYVPGGAAVTVPEPGTLVLFGAGLFGFATYRLRKRRA